MKVAIVHDWLVGGGAERVVLELHKLYPKAPIYTSYCTSEWRAKLDNNVVTGYLQYWPFSKLRKFLPVLRGRWFQSLDLSEFDLVISSKGNGEANYIQTTGNTKHICYCHTPTHFYWRQYDQYYSQPGFGWLNPVVRIALKLLVVPLRKRDYQAAQKVDHFIANSTHIQADIKTFYGRDADVVHPPVDVGRFSAGTGARSYFVTVGRQVPYKRNDIIVEACNQLELPLKVYGRGPEHAKLRKLAGPTIEFFDNASDADIVQGLKHAKAFIFAAHEDFGITPVEALASGTPVIAYKAGGALDYVQPGVNGEFFTEQSIESLAKVLTGLRSYDPQTVQATATQFSAEHFQAAIKKILNS